VGSISRNAPCPCGSRKKYKRCCQARDAAAASPPAATQTEPVAPAKTTAQAMRSRAFRLLIAFAEKPAVAARLAAASRELWGPEFDERDDDEQRAAFERPEAEAGSVTYCLLDAPTVAGTTIAEQFLAKRIKTLAPVERDYLQRLAATRMGLYRIEKVYRDRRLTCVDLWTNERIELRERKLTHDVKPSWVIGARTFPAIDGATELDGAIYAFSEAQARTVVHLLRREWIAARTETPDLNEALFLKRRFPVLIHRCWFDDVFFAADEAPEKSFGVGAVEPLHRKRAADLQNFHLADPQLRELAAFLYSSAAPTAMTIDRLHGFLTALNCAATPVRPQSWIPVISGAEPLRLRSQEHCETIINAIYALADEIARQLSAGTFEPLLPSRPGAGMEHIAQGWCIGFVEGMGLQQRSWDELTNDPQFQMSIMPILMLVDPSALDENATPNPATTADMVNLLPTAVALIFDYWVETRPTRGIVGALRAHTARASERAKRGATEAADSWDATVHRLKIMLEGVRPAARAIQDSLPARSDPD
jgi:uncharacterized protein